MGELAALSAAFLWAWTATFFTIAGRHIGSWAVNTFRVPLGLLFLVITFLLMGGSFHATPYQLIILSISGIIGLTLGDGFLFEAFVLIGPRLTTLIFTISPLITAVLAYLFLKETIGPIGLTGMILTISGVTWVVAARQNGSRRISLKGVGFALIGASGQAVGLILAKLALNTGMEALPATIFRMAGALASMILLFPFFKNSYSDKFSRGIRRAIWPLLGGTICGPFLGVWLSQVSIKLTLTGIAATLMATVPIIILPISRYIEKDRITLRAVLGALVAVTGVAMLFIRAGS